MDQRLSADEIAGRIYASHLDADQQLCCEHVAEDGRLFGWHHHDGPHACDWGNHGGECPWRAQQSR